MTHGSIIAIDPGKITGLATLSQSQDVPETCELDALAFYSFVLENMRFRPSSEVLIEAFVFTSSTLKKTFEPWSTEMIGLVKAACSVYGHTLITPLPKASEAKSLVSNDVLRRLGWWHIGGEGHANDALRHLARYGFISGWLDKRLLLS